MRSFPMSRLRAKSASSKRWNKTQRIAFMLPWSLKEEPLKPERRHTTPASVFCLHWTKSNPCSSKAAVIRREGLMDFSLEASHGNFRHGASVGSIGGKLRLLVLHDLPFSNLSTNV